MNDGKRRIWGDELWVYVDEGKVGKEGLLVGLGLGLGVGRRATNEKAKLMKRRRH